jgi:hypothetical protein
MSKRANFYVYHVYVDHTLRYIGKGCNGRHRVHERIARNRHLRRAAGHKLEKDYLYDRFAAALRRGQVITSKIIVPNLTELSAYSLERRKVRVFRKAHPGQLWNTLDGGVGMTSEEAKRISDAYYSNPANRRRMTRLARERQADPEFQERASEAIKLALSDPAVRRRMSRGISKAFAGPAARAKSAKAIRRAHDNDPGIALRMSKTRKAWWKVPGNREQQVRSNKRAWSCPKLRAKHSKLVKTICADPIVKQNKSKGAKKFFRDHPKALKYFIEGNARRWGDPKYRRRMSRILTKSMNKPSVRKAISQRQTGRYRNPAARKAHSLACLAGHARRRAEKAGKEKAYA